LRELRPTRQQLSSALDAAAVSASCREHLSLQRSAARAVCFTAVAAAAAAAQKVVTSRTDPFRVCYTSARRCRHILP